MDFKSPVRGDGWKMGCPKSLMWESEGEAGRRMKMRLLPPPVKALCAMMRCTSSGCMGPVTRSLFSCRIGELEVALSCHMALDMLCQEMHKAWYVVAARSCVKEGGRK